MAKDEKSKSTERRQPNRIVRYIQETIGELKKVNWPTRQEAINLTVIVLIVTFSDERLPWTVGSYLFPGVCFDLELSPRPEWNWVKGNAV